MHNSTLQEPTSKNTEKSSPVLSPEANKFGAKGNPLSKDLLPPTGEIAQNIMKHPPKDMGTDLNKVISVEKLVRQTLELIRERQKQEILIFENIKQIGEHFYRIGWDEKDKDCMRNKHGFTNRLKDAGNKPNLTGAKLDFETLAHLEDLKDDERINLFIQSCSPLQTSLEALKNKLDFILLTEYQYLSKLQLDEIKNWDSELKRYTNQNDEDTDINLLLNVAAFSHDEECLGLLDKFLKELDSPWYKHLGFGEKVDCYALGYFIVEFGEFSKEISRFVKPKDSSLKNLFGKLGKLRDTIKGCPEILAESDHHSLLRMKKKIEQAAPSLKKIIEALLNLIKPFHQNGILDYDKINMVETDTTQSKFEKENSSDIEKARSCFSKKKAPQNEKPRTLEADIEALKDKIRCFEAQIRSEVGETEKILCEIPFNHKDFDKFMEFEAGNFMKKLNNYLDSSKDHQNPSNSFQKRLDHNLDLINKQLKEISLEKNNEQSKGLKMRKKDIEELKRISIIYSDVLASIWEKNDEDLKEFNAKLEKILKEKSLKNKILKSKGELSKKQEEEQKQPIQTSHEEQKKEKEEKQNTSQEVQISTQALQKNSPSLENKAKNSSQELRELLGRAISEVENLFTYQEFLQKIGYDEANDLFPKFLRAEKMSFGLLGQYYKNIFKKENEEKLSQFIIQNSILAKDCFNVIKIRHQQLMHQLHKCDIQAINQTIIKQAVPWREDLKSISFCLMEDLEEKELLQMPETSPITFDVKNLTEHNQILYNWYMKIVSLNRLLKSDKAILEYNELMKQVTDETDPKLLTEIHWQAGLAYQYIKDFDKVIGPFQKGLYQAKMIPEGDIVLLKRVTLGGIDQVQCPWRNHRVFALQYDLALAYIQKKKFKEAQFHLEEILSCDSLSSTERLSVDFQLSIIERKHGHQEVSKKRMELMYLNSFEEISSNHLIWGFSILFDLSIAYLEGHNLEEAIECIKLLQSYFNDNENKLRAAQGQKLLLNRILVNEKIHRISLIKAALKDDKECQQEVMKTHDSLLEDQNVIENSPFLTNLKEYNRHNFIIAIILGEITTRDILPLYGERNFENIGLIQDMKEEVKRDLLELKNFIFSLEKDKKKIKELEESLFIKKLKESLGVKLYIIAIKNFGDKMYKEAKEYMQKSILCQWLDDFILFERDDSSLQLANSTDIDKEKLRKYLSERVSKSGSASTIFGKYERSKGDSQKKEDLLGEYEIGFLRAIAVEQKLFFTNLKIHEKTLTFRYFKFDLANSDWTIETLVCQHDEAIKKINNIGIVYFNDKMFSLACDCFDHVIYTVLKLNLNTSNQDYASNFYWRGSTHQKMKKFEMAIQDFQRVIEYKLEDEIYNEARIKLKECSMEQQKAKRLKMFSDAISRE